MNLFIGSPHGFKNFSTNDCCYLHRHCIRINKQTRFHQKESWFLKFVKLFDELIKIDKWKVKVKKILEDCRNSIPSPSVKIQIMGGKVGLRCKGKTLLGIVNKLLETKSLFCQYCLKQTFQPIIWIFTEGEGIEFRLSS